MKNLKRYLRVWLKLTAYSFMTMLTSRFSFGLFFIGKALRFTFFFVFLLFLLSKTKVLAGYNLYQAALFVLTYNLIDTGVQLLFREVYRFRPLVVSGNFDLVLAKPLNPLFRVLAGGADVVDLLMFIPFVLGTIYLAGKIGGITLGGVIFYLLLIANAFLIASAFHIAVLALGILTTEIDNSIMLYRDVTRMAMIPIDVYQEPLRFSITYILPVGIMMAFPAKALMGLLSGWGIFVALSLGLSLFWLSLKLWHYALNQYSSASS